ncbi:MAG: HAD-IA family hydrolase [Lentisphaerae bacterium]|nr:HAD-IA family hydrolase [Lentisphaerota bacterium]
MIQGIIFDMDGVLCDSEPFITQAAVALFRERHGVAVQGDDFLPFTGMGENRFLGGVAERYGVRLDLETDKAFTYARYLDLISGRLQPLSGVAAFIAQCRRMGWRLAVASSADRVKVDGNLAELGFGGTAFDAVIDGSQVARKKPAPDLFLLAAAQLGLDPAGCVVFEDAVAGVQAAGAAGMRAIGVRGAFDDARLRAAGAAATVNDLTEAAEALARLG